MSSNKATFAAGCFWGTEHYFKKKFGGAIIDGKVGFMGGPLDNPSYKDVCTGETGHAEVYHMQFDPTKTSFIELLDYFFRMHDSTVLNTQCGDQGTQYRSAVFYEDEDQKMLALEYISKLNNDLSSEQRKGFTSAFGDDAKTVTSVEPAGQFWTAEEYHQQFLTLNPDGYCSHKIYW